MKAHVLTGSKQEIAAAIARMDGDVREAIVFVEEPVVPTSPPTMDDLFAEMDPYMVQVGGADYSRESIYSRLSATMAPATEDIVAEMNPYMVSVGEFDDSRESIYSR